MFVVFCIVDVRAAASSSFYNRWRLMYQQISSSVLPLRTYFPLSFSSPHPPSFPFSIKPLSFLLSFPFLLCSLFPSPLSLSPHISSYLPYPPLSPSLSPSLPPLWWLARSLLILLVRSVCLSVCLCVCLSVCLSIGLSRSLVT